MTEPTTDVWQLLLQCRRELLESLQQHRCEGFDANDYIAAVHIGRQQMREECIQAITNLNSTGIVFEADAIEALRQVQL